VFKKLHIKEVLKTQLDFYIVYLLTGFEIVFDYQVTSVVFKT